MDRDISRFRIEEGSAGNDFEGLHRDGNDEDGYETIDDSEDSAGNDEFPTVPVILPRSRFAGICNRETVKDGKHTSQSNN